MSTSSGPARSKEKNVLISGGGIAGLTLGILLKEKGWDPLVIERDPALPAEGYMMDFFGAGWDVAERMGLVDDIRAIRYPIDRLEYVDRNGRPRFPGVPIDRVRRALGGRYAPLRRPDLVRIFFDRASASGVPVRFGTTIRSLAEAESGVRITFDDDTADEFRLVFGADGVHSRVRELMFGPEPQFDRFLGYYVAAFHVARSRHGIDRALEIYEEPGRALWCYPSDDQTIDAIYIFRHGDVGRLPREKRLEFVKEQAKGMGWIAERLLEEARGSGPIYFDSATQTVMPSWHKGRIALLGDACGCLTLLAGQGSHMAMADAYVLARELEKSGGDHIKAFQAYVKYLKPVIARKQAEARRMAPLLLPSSRWQMAIRYPLLRLIYSDLLIGQLFGAFGAKSVLAGYD
jgi:2-polyprenyl-6-methoxyphenol hydroxylase-like FAD-dependent oxidoreductase